MHAEFSFPPQVLVGSQNHWTEPNGPKAKEKLSKIIKISKIIKSNCSLSTGEVPSHSNLEFQVISTGGIMMEKES